jgi:uncharacterized Zn-binding protein involved in type VI secretion
VSKEGAGKGQGKVVCLIPDICLTPVGPAQVPVPYPVTASFEESQGTSPNVTFAGKPAFLKGQSLIPYTLGDQAGFCGGIRSKTCGGIVEAIQGSSSVFVNGKAVVRHGDLFKMNNGNTFGKAICPGAPERRGSIDASGKITVDTNPPAEAKTPEEKRFAEKVGEWWDKTKSQVGEAKAHPVEGVKGAAKDTANLIPDTGELVAKGEFLEGAQEQSETAGWLRMAGMKQSAEKVESSAEGMRQSAQQVHLSHLDLTNAAQEGGAKIALGLQILTGAAGLAKGGWEGIRAVSKMIGRETGPEVKLLNETTKLEKAVVKEGEAASKAEVIEKGPEITEKPTTTEDGVRITKSVPPVDEIMGIEVHGWKAKNIRPGTNNKIAIVGRPMSEVREYKSVLEARFKGEGYQVEVFDEESGTIPEYARAEFKKATKNSTVHLTPEETMETSMYKENENWANKIKSEGYTIVNIGNPLNVPRPSAFFDMEQRVIFDGK